MESKDLPKSNNKIFINTCLIKKGNIKKCYRFKYIKNSCRYDSFFFIHSLLINSYIKERNLQLNKFATYIFNISEEIKKLDASIFNHGFWKFIKDYNFDFFGILAPKNGFQGQYPISNVFTFLHNDNNYCIYYTKNSICSICNKYIKESKNMNILIPINKSDYRKKNLSDILGEFFSASKTACAICIYDPKEGLKPDNMFHICNAIYITKVNFQNFLFFILDVSNEFELDTEQYHNLVDDKNIYKHLISLDFNIYNYNYSLKGILNQKYISHYTATLIDISESVNSFLINTIYYYYDDMLNYNYIKEIKYCANNQNYLEDILDYNPFILIYVKQN